MPHPLLDRLSRLLPSSRPRWAMMPTGPATHFTELLLFVASALEHVGIGYVIQYGTLLGAERLGAPLPWDEDHDVFVYDVAPDQIRAKLQHLLERHGYRLVWDPGGFFWVRERYWLAASGHLALEFLPPLVERAEDLPVWDGGAPHLAVGELAPLKPTPIYSSFVWAPAATEAVLARTYGASGSREAMRAFAVAPMTREASAFWAKARTLQAVDWPAISERFQRRSRWKPMLAAPWWWFNGGYIIAINKLKGWARAKLARLDAAPPPHA